MTTYKELAPVPFEHQVRLAEAMAKSKLFGMNDANQVLALMALCESEGLHPARAVAEYHIVQGRPALKADAMLARFQRAGGKVQWEVYTDTEVSGTFSHPQGGTLRLTWTMEQAIKAKLTGKDVWRQYPRQMLRARCISEAVRSLYPGVAVGIYTPEEVQDFTPETEKEVIKTIGSLSKDAEALERAIKEQDIDRERVIRFIKAKWQACVFSELTHAQCQQLITNLPRLKARANAPAPRPGSIHPEADKLRDMARQLREKAERSDDPQARIDDLADAQEYEARALEIELKGGVQPVLQETLQ